MYDEQRLETRVIVAHTYGITPVECLPGGGLRSCIARIGDVRRRKIISVEPNEPQGWVAAGWDDQQAACLAPLDAAERHFGYAITRAEIMDYLSQTYGPVFVEDLIKHLLQSG